MAQPKIFLTRIDDRFIYAQDIEQWNEAVGSNLVLIVNDGIAADSRKWAAPMDPDHGSVACGRTGAG